MAFGAAPNLAQYAPPDLAQTSKISAKILAKSGKPVPGARLLVYHISSARLFQSAPTRPDGECIVPALPYGYYDLAIEAPDGLYIADRVINVAPSGASDVVFTLAAFETGTAALARKHPGSERDPVGVAAMQIRARGRDFWRSPKGVAIIAGVSGAALLAIASGAEAEDEATPF